MAQAMTEDCPCLRKRRIYRREGMLCEIPGGFHRERRYVRRERKALLVKAFFSRSTGRTPARRQVASGTHPAPEVPLLRKCEV